MKTVDSIADARAWHRAEADVGLVPTMGFLHDGHLALVRRAREECERVAASIFVNPSQFNRAADLESYPRDLERDLALLEEEGCDLAFLPPAAEIYPPGFQTWVAPGPVAAPNEGAHRLGHFRGVATVVLKLFNIFQPRRAYFGQKDAQQLAVIRTLCRDFDLPVEVVGVETVRESDGLAMSSRNALLSASDRRAAAVLYRALRGARHAWSAGERRAGELLSRMRRVLAGEPEVRLDYLSVADPETFAELDTVRGRAVLSLAAFVGPARLIDNILIEESD
ncbi:MAG: pantoate--beta-alanine ligase [Thermoanaerobaculia bacterium]